MRIDHALPLGVVIIKQHFLTDGNTLTALFEQWQHFNSTFLGGAQIVRTVAVLFLRDRIWQHFSENLATLLPHFLTSLKHTFSTLFPYLIRFPQTRLPGRLPPS